jgi:cytochrome c-type biogenesis protein
VQVSAWTPYLTIVVGPLLVVLGIWFLSGREFSLRLPRLSNNAGTGLAGMYVYGIVYATVSLSCTIPVFLVAVVGAFRSESWLSGVMVLLAYAAGMGLVLTALAIALALAKDGFVRNSRRVLPYLNRFAGVLLMVAGVYVTWYGYVEIRVLAGDAVSRGPVDAVARWSGSVTTAIDNNSTLVALALAGVVVAALIGLSFRRRRSPITSVTAGESTAVPSGKDLP